MLQDNWIETKENTDSNDSLWRALYELTKVFSEIDSNKKEV